MSSIALNFFRQIGRFSILYVLAAPIYIFATEEYKTTDNNPNGDVKLALAILIIFVVLTTLSYWENPSRNKKWKILDRLTVLSIMSLTAIYGNNDSRSFIGAGVYFYLLGHSGEFKNYNSFINHIVFRFFAGLGVLIFIVNNDLANGLFLLSNFLIIIGLIFINVKKLKLSRKFNRREEIKESILIF